MLPSALDVPALFHCCRALSGAQINSLSVPNRPQEAPKSTLGGSKIDPRSPKRVQERPKSVPGAPKSVRQRRKSAPRASQERSKSAQERPKSAARAPKSAARAPKSAPRAAQERPGTPQKALGAPFCSFGARRKGISKTIRRKTRSRSAFGMIFNQISHRARKRGHMENM